MNVILTIFLEQEPSLLSTLFKLHSKSEQTLNEGSICLKGLVNSIAPSSNFTICLLFIFKKCSFMFCQYIFSNKTL